MDDHFVQVVCIATSVLTVLLAVITTLLNGFLLYVLYKDPLKRFANKPVITFITAITVMDFLTGVLCDTSQARYEIRCAMKMKTETEFELKGFTAVVAFFTINSATLLILTMSIERLVAVGFPHFYRRAATRKLANATAIGVCVYCFVFSMLQLADVNLGTWETVDLYQHTVFPITSVIVIYFAIAFMLRRQRQKLFHSKTNQDNETISQPNSYRNRTENYKKERKIVFTAFLITLLLLLSFLPYTIMITATARCESCNTKEWFVLISRIALPLAFSNSVANPFVYVLSMRDVRRSMKVIVNRSLPQANNTIAVVEQQGNAINGGEKN